MSTHSNRLDTVYIDGRKVRAVRKHERKLTQAALAALLTRVSRGYISVIETNPAARISRAAAEELAEALAVPLRALVVPPPDQELDATPDAPPPGLVYNSPEGDEPLPDALVADLTPLYSALARLPAERQQACVDALAQLLDCMSTAG